MSKQKKQSFLGGAAILAAAVVVVKIIGALYKIPLGNILDDEGFGHFNNADVIYNLLLTIEGEGLVNEEGWFLNRVYSLGVNASRTYYSKYAEFTTTVTAIL